MRKINSFFNLFGQKKSFNKQRSNIGLDLGSFSLKLLSLKKNPENERWNIMNYGCAALENQTTEEQGRVLKRMVEELKFPKGSATTINIPNDISITRYLMMPKMRPEELKKALQFEIEKYISFDSKEAIYDFHILGEDADEAHHSKILLVAAKSDDILKRVNLVEEAGLSVRVVSISPIGLKNVFYFNYKGKENLNVALVDLGSRFTNINIVKNGISNFIRDIPISGDDITMLIGEKKELTMSEAEKFKKAANKAHEYKEIVNSALTGLLNEIYLSFDYYETQFESGIDEVYLAGGTALLPGLKEFLEENLDAEIHILNPFINFDIIPEHALKIKELHSQLAVCAGLGLEEE